MPLFTRAKEDGSAEATVTEPTYLPGAPDVGESGVRGIDGHRDYLRSNVAPLRPFGIGLLDAAELTLCESITSDIDLPTFTSATVEGWAVRASNLVGASDFRPVVLPVVDEIAAGGFRGAPLTPGTAVRVEAGAPIPEGADAVVALADGVVLGEDVRFIGEATFQQNLEMIGSRISDGDALLSSGTKLTPRSLALLAEVGHDKVLARPRPRVVVLTAALDLVEPGVPLTKLHQRYDSGTVLLAASARTDSAQVFPTGVVDPEPKALERALSEQLVRADLVLLLAEPTDELVRLLGDIGAVDSASVDGLADRQVFALIGDERTPVLVLPTEPVAAYLTYLLFGRPLLQKLAGAEAYVPTEVTAPVTTDIAADPQHTRLLLARHTSRGITPLPVPSPGAAELADANAVIIVPAGDPIPAHGDVSCWLLY